MEKILKAIKNNCRGFSPFAVAVSIGIVLTAVTCIFSVYLYHDSANVYAFMARALVNNEFQDAFHPAIPSLNTLLSWPLTLAGISPERSLLFISCLFYVLTIVSLYCLLKKFLPENLAGTGALLFAAAPGVIRFFCASLIDSGKTFFLVTALYFLYRFAESKFRSFKHAVFLGCMLGGLALARSEGIGMAAIIVLCLGYYYLYEAVQRKKLPPVLPLLTLFAAFAILIFSRMCLLYSVTKKFIFDTRISEGIEGIICKLTGGSAAVEAVQKGDLPSVTWAHLLKDCFRGSYEPYLVFAVAGFVLFILAAVWKNAAKLFPDRKIPDFMTWNNFYYVFIIAAAGNLLIFKMPSFVAYRYFLLNIPLLMLFTSAGGYLLWRWCAVRLSTKVAFYALLITAVSFQIGSGLKNVFSSRSRNAYNSGLYLASLLNAPRNTGRIWFIGKTGSEWYYSGMRRAVPIETPLPDIGTYTDFEYVLCKKKSEELQVIERRKDLKEIFLPPESTVKLFQRIK